MQSNFKFTNWGRNIKVNIPKFHQPTNEKEIAAIVKSARKIRVVGAGHSWSAVCVSEEVLINLDNYNKIIAVNKEHKQVKVQAGIRLKDLNKELDKIGLALINLGSIDHQSLAGALSTCTHGSGKNHQILASQVEDYSLIMADGTIKKIEKSHPLYRAALTGMGAFGVISEITLNVCKAFNIKDKTILVSFEEALENIEKWNEECDHFKMWWIPHTDEMIVYKHNRTQQNEQYSKFYNWFRLKLLDEYLYQILLIIGHIFNGLRPFLNKLMIQSYRKPFNRIQKSYEVFAVPEPPIHRETEWAFPIEDARMLLKKYKALIDNSQHKINFIQEIRFTKGDDFMLSPCYKRDSVWMGAYLIDNKGWNEILNDFENFALSHNGRPHWGKEFTANKSYLGKHYQELENFKELMKSHDPTSKFKNPWLEQIFG